MDCHTHSLYHSERNHLNTKETDADHSNNGTKEKPEEERTPHSPRRSESATNAYIGKIT